MDFLCSIGSDSVAIIRLLDVSSILADMNRCVKDGGLFEDRWPSGGAYINLNKFKSKKYILKDDFVR